MERQTEFFFSQYSLLAWTFRLVHSNQNDIFHQIRGCVRLRQSIRAITTTELLLAPLLCVAQVTTVAKAHQPKMAIPK